MSNWNNLAWAEESATKLLLHRLGTGDVLLAQSNQLLNILLVGMAGALAWGVKIFAAGAGPVEWGAAAVALWLAAVAVALTRLCIATRETQVPYNIPDHTYRPTASEEDVRWGEMLGVQARIEATVKRNAAVAYWLDRCRYAAAATPVVFAVAAAAVVLLRR